jgi:hypothetical protein
MQGQETQRNVGLCHRGQNNFLRLLRLLRLSFLGTPKTPDTLWTTDNYPNYVALFTGSKLYKRVLN